jgi:hypothetical protein
MLYALIYWEMDIQFSSSVLSFEFNIGPLKSKGQMLGRSQCQDLVGDQALNPPHI